MKDKITKISESLNAALIDWDGANPSPDEVYYILTRLAEQALELRNRCGVRPLVSEKLGIAWMIKNTGTQVTRLNIQTVKRPQ